MSNIGKIAIFQNLPPGGAKCFYNELIPKLETKYRVKIFSIPNKIFNSFPEYLKYSLIDLPKEHYRLAEEINKGKFDIVLVHHDYLTKSPYILRYLKIPTFYLCHEEPREFYEDKSYFSTSLKHIIVNFLRLPLKYIDRINCSKATVVIANSQFSQQKLFKIYKRNFEYLKLGINTNNFTIVEKTDNNNYFLTVGALAKFKGIDFLINSISKLPKGYQYPLVVVGGKGRDYNYLLRLSKEKGVKLIHKQNLSDKQLLDLYNNATLLLAAAINEPFGLSLLEALSCGLPVVAVNEGGYSEILQNCEDCGLVERDDSLFAKTIEQLLTQNINRSLLHKYVDKEWNINNTVECLTKLFEKYTS